MPATKIVVNIPGETPYDVRIGATVLAGLGESVRRLDGVGRAPHLLVLTDSNVGPLYLEYRGLGAVDLLSFTLE